MAQGQLPAELPQLEAKARSLKPNWKTSIYEDWCYAKYRRIYGEIPSHLSFINHECNRFDYDNISSENLKNEWNNGENEDAKLMERICKKAPNSPLCGNWKLYYSLKKITEDRLDPKAKWWNIVLGMSYAESHIGQNYAPDRIGGTCAGRNNFGGAKYKINDDNSRVYKSNKFGGYNTTERFTDSYGCNLYPFDSIEEYWISKVNGIRYGYKGCIKSETPINCIAFAYVGNPKKAEPNWVANVSSFLN